MRIGTHLDYALVINIELVCAVRKKIPIVRQTKTTLV